jgi:uncharacterized protein YeaO (DUF488 family)
MCILDIQVKRVYEPATADDGRRVLVDRVWPRGLSREHAQLDDWIPGVAPSTELRKWFGHDPARWDTFCRRYETELADNPEVDQLRTMSAGGRLTLLFSARDTQHNQAVVLARHLREQRPRAPE